MINFLNICVLHFETVINVLDGFLIKYKHFINLLNIFSYQINLVEIRAFLLLFKWLFLDLRGKINKIFQLLFLYFFKLFVLNFIECLYLPFPKQVRVTEPVCDCSRDCIYRRCKLVFHNCKIVVNSLLKDSRFGFWIWPNYHFPIEFIQFLTTNCSNVGWMCMISFKAVLTTTGLSPRASLIQTVYSDHLSMFTPAHLK